MAHDTVQPTRRSRRLFWKLALALWLATAIAGALTMGYVRLADLNVGPQPVDDPLRVGGIPLAPLAAGVLATLIVGTAFAWYLLRPLRALRKALHRLAEGHLDTRVQPAMGRRSDEIVDLAHDIDTMAARLQQLAESRRQLLHDISHELRSPLTRLQAAVGLLRQAHPEAAEMAGRIEREGERLDALVEELLTLHRLEAGAAVPPRERVDVVELLQAIVDDADFEARASGRRVSIDADAAFVSDVHGELLYRAFENVVRNAVKYAPAGTAVEVRAAPGDDGSLVTTVADRGPGVPAAMIDRIFEPFVRVEGPEAFRGAGLGLAIARRAFAMHGGRIEAAAREGGGLVVWMVLPAPRRQNGSPT